MAVRFGERSLAGVFEAGLDEVCLEYDHFSRNHGTQLLIDYSFYMTWDVYTLQGSNIGFLGDSV